MSNNNTCLQRVRQSVYRCCTATRWCIEVDMRGDDEGRWAGRCATDAFSMRVNLISRPAGSTFISPISPSAVDIDIFAWS
jgi:hypothetical protein